MTTTFLSLENDTKKEKSFTLCLILAGFAKKGRQKTISTQ